MKKLALALLVAASAACGRKPEAAKTATAPQDAPVAGEKLINYDAAGGAFSCRAPAAWKAVEDGYSGGPLVMFMGPAAGPRRGTASIGVARYPSPGDPIKTPQEYAAMLARTDGKPSALEAREVDGRTVYALHYEVPQRAPRGRKTMYMNREDAVLIPGASGFFLLSHTAPADGYQDTLPVFEAVVRSFRPKS